MNMACCCYGNLSGVTDKVFGQGTKALGMLCHNIGHPDIRFFKQANVS